MKRRVLLATPLLAAGPAVAQPNRPHARIGLLTAQRAASMEPFLPTLRAGLAAAGLVEGRNLTLETRFGDDDLSRVPALMEELVRLPVQVLLVQGAAVSVVVRARPPVPVVFVLSGNPVAAGIAQSLARPPVGFTGLTLLSAELNAKRLELLHDLRPGLRRVAVIANPDHPGETLERSQIFEMAERLGITISLYHTRSRAELDAAFAAMDADALCVFADGFVLQNREAIARFAIARRMPLISGWRAFAESGALITYGPRLAESYRRFAYFVDRILRGTPPEELPIERPSVFELVINQRTAAAIGVEIPLSLLARADLVIE
ncbi:MAG: ABC transporter substrate-binding protein [Roseomonas sp.]|nr:ABC transporter substrate-binding protein [Roseomonas sp.]MCA3585899.1 ABC transporter substrate-binding protein [Methylocystis sp.]MCA3593902.1 ABC transporter substrate-binding protein [Methylobacterium sp.]MCA3326585.1 ABC transporter substrate-binding protein [Roseomonas sp.]MCA3332331.1 ABC transporter substrate-binding protein [Roseomonas sp.]